MEQPLCQLAGTQMISAHWLRTMRHADLILVLDQGTSIERGTPEERISQHGAHAQIIQRQLAKAGRARQGRRDALLKR